MSRQPLIWIVEDEARQVDFVTRTLAAMYEGAVAAPFRNADAALRALVLAQTTTASFPDLMIVDLAIPAGRGGLSQVPGVDVALAARAADPEVRIIVRTGLQEDVLPLGILDERTQLCRKGDPPEAFLHLVSSFLALEGFQSSPFPIFVTPSLPVAAGPTWFSTSLVLAAIPAATSVWVASLLQVTSVHGPVFASWMIGLGLIGGGAISASNVVGYRSRVGAALAIVGGLITIFAGLILPPIG